LRCSSSRENTHLTLTDFIFWDFVKGNVCGCPLLVILEESMTWVIEVYAKTDHSIPLKFGRKLNFGLT
jgi:hypothetical protein